MESILTFKPFNSEIPLLGISRGNWSYAKDYTQGCPPLQETGGICVNRGTKDGHRGSSQRYAFNDMEQHVRRNYLMVSIIENKCMKMITFLLYFTPNYLSQSLLYNNKKCCERFRAPLRTTNAPTNCLPLRKCSHHTSQAFHQERNPTDGLHWHLGPRAGSCADKKRLWPRSRQSQRPEPGPQHSGPHTHVAQASK